jgi:uncharacterized membrane protein
MVFLLALASLVAAQTQIPVNDQIPGNGPPVAGPAAEWIKAEHAHTIPMRDMPRMLESEGRREKPLRLLPRAGKPIPPTPKIDIALQAQTLAAVSVGNVTAFAGVGNGDYGFAPNSAPPDTNLSVGATQVVQWVNESFAVFSKTGTLLAGPTAGNALFQALGATHPCAVHNDGDPIAEYDKAANRWVLTQFSVTSGSTQGYWQCVAVSQTSDATGAYNVYAFNYGTTQFIDYPKLGVWNNAYYITYNVFTNGTTFAGPKLCAFDRASMLAGTAATQICFQLGTSFGGVLPADLDGSTPPPAGSPEYFVDFNTNSLDIFTISNPNFTNGTATMGGPTNIAVAAFSPACSGGGTCIPQSGTTQKLDSLADRLMYRLAYRNFGDHEALLVNHTITSGTSAAIRWYEIRSPGSAPTIFQQGTFAPDASFRWMGSAAMDHAGNIAIGYSVSSTSLNPAIRFTGRAPTDPLGTLGTEISIKTGAGSQNGNLSRWGDYSSLSVDPVDDCTLWYTTEYLKATGSFNWSTEIANFKFSSCGNPDYSVTASPASQSVTQGNNTSYTVTVTPTGGFTGSVDLTVSGLPAGATGTFSPTPVTSGNSTLTVTTTSTTPTGSFPLTITGTSGTTTHTASVTLVVTAPVAPDFAVSATPASQTVTAGGSTSYTANVTASGGFTGVVSLSASGLPAGASASFTPASVTGSGSSTVSVTTTTATAAGTYPITITGTSGILVHSASVTLVVNAAPVPDFALSSSPASLTVIQGASGSSTITVTPSGGFTGSVTLAASGLPAGVTAAFGTNPTTATSVLTFTASATATVGTATVTVTGTSGALTHTTNISLTVASNAPQQLIVNGGFENATAAPWTLTAGVLNSSTAEPPHSGVRDAWLDGYGRTHTDSAVQTVTIPASAATATLSFWLHIDTAETTTTTAFDTLQVQVLNSSGTVLATLGTFSNLNKAPGYVQRSFNVIQFKGQTVMIRFLGMEDVSLQTSFVIDDVTLNVQ